ncbi:MAG TPA: TetR/AcrR family transcriptional regulator [Thermoanaerobaculia bacterium]|nr:TetR/AcrR family transcriptional regulator [Thermoanaerobaculia bacterium]
MSSEASGTGRLRSVKTPRQARSRRSLDRILDATRELLEDRSFDQISIAEIVARAGSSVGVFYSRFADKQALLDCLDELYALDVIRELGGLAESWQKRRPSLQEMVEEATRRLITFHRARRGLVRALILHARLHVDGPFAERTRRMQRQPGIADALLAHRDEIDHPDPERAARFSLVQALTAVREHVLFAEGPAAIVPLDGEALAREVERAWLAYLRGPAPPFAPGPRSRSHSPSTHRKGRP